MSGNKTSGQRPKTSKHLRAGTQKNFKKTDEATMVTYRTKLAERAKRKQKKRNRKG